MIEAYQHKGIVFKQGFGMTEVGVNCFAMTDENARLKAGSIGTPMMFTEARVVDADNRSMRSGEVGELARARERRRGGTATRTCRGRESAGRARPPPAGAWRFGPSSG